MRRELRVKCWNEATSMRHEVEVMIGRRKRMEGVSELR